MTTQKVYCNECKYYRFDDGIGAKLCLNKKNWKPPEEGQYFLQRPKGYYGDIVYGGLNKNGSCELYIPNIWMKIKSYINKYKV